MHNILHVIVEENKIDDQKVFPNLFCILQIRKLNIHFTVIDKQYIMHVLKLKFNRWYTITI